MLEPSSKKGLLPWMTSRIKSRRSRINWKQKWRPMICLARLNSTETLNPTRSHLVCRPRTVRSLRSSLWPNPSSMQWLRARNKVARSEANPGTTIVCLTLSASACNHFQRSEEILNLRTKTTANQASHHRKRKSLMRLLSLLGTKGTIGCHLQPSA